MTQPPPQPPTPPPSNDALNTNSRSTAAALAVAFMAIATAGALLPLGFAAAWLSVRAVAVMLKHGVAGVAGVAIRVAGAAGSAVGSLQGQGGGRGRAARGMVLVMVMVLCFVLGNEFHSWKIDRLRRNTQLQLNFESQNGLGRSIAGATVAVSARAMFV